MNFIMMFSHTILERNHVHPLDTWFSFLTPTSPLPLANEALLRSLLFVFIYFADPVTFIRVACHTGILKDDMFCLIFRMHLGELPISMAVHHVHARCPWSADEGVRSPETGVTHWCELLCGDWDLNLDFLEEPVTLTTESSFQLHRNTSRVLLIGACML